MLLSSHLRGEILKQHDIPYIHILLSLRERKEKIIMVISYPKESIEDIIALRKGGQNVIQIVQHLGTIHYET